MKPAVKGQIKLCSPKAGETLGRLMDIWESAVRQTHSFLTEADIQAIYPQVRGMLEQLNGVPCFCDESGQILGFIHVEQRNIEMLFVHARARGQGAGKALVEYARASLGACYVDVNEQNQQGEGFYRHLGFHTVARSALDGQGRPFPLLHMALFPQAHNSSL